ncbi:hypothetical protein [Campylobacter fetus]|nr:hypothetical protein [Campylobacter fetus]
MNSVIVINDCEVKFEVVNSEIFTKPSRKAPSFSYGDIRLSQKN